MDKEEMIHDNEFYSSIAYHNLWDEYKGVGKVQPKAISN